WSTQYKECGFDDFFKLSQQPCYYCGQKPYISRNIASGKRKPKISKIQIELGNFVYNGLDRIDNTKGHTVDNVVTCCYRCNQGRNDMTQEQFFNLIKLIYNKHFSSVK